MYVQIVFRIKGYVEKEVFNIFMTTESLLCEHLTV